MKGHVHNMVDHSLALLDEVTEHYVHGDGNFNLHRFSKQLEKLYTGHKESTCLTCWQGSTRYPEEKRLAQEFYARVAQAFGCGTDEMVERYGKELHLVIKDGEVWYDQPIYRKDCVFMDIVLARVVFLLLRSNLVL